jgi:hypothetical protein
MGGSFTLRSGKFVPADEVFRAWTSGDLDQMLRVLNLQTNPIDRHYLLVGIVKETYKRRADAAMARECARVAEIHLAEFQELAQALKGDGDGTLPRVPTFQNYATLLAELGDYDRAVWVCELAKYYGLEDGTKAGFDGRIARIRKMQQARHI